MKLQCRQVACFDREKHAVKMFQKVHDSLP